MFWLLLIAQLSASFTSETVWITLQDSTVEVKGWYVFRNPSTEPQHLQIFYPFPLGRTEPYPDTFAVHGGRARPTPEGLRIQVRLEPQATETLRVFYRQRIQGHRARYITHTTRLWDKPLKEARFYIRFPARWKQMYTSFPVQEVREEGTWRVLVLSRRNFRGEGDLQMVWEP